MIEVKMEMWDQISTFNTGQGPGKGYAYAKNRRSSSTS